MEALKEEEASLLGKDLQVKASPVLVNLGWGEERHLEGLIFQG